MLGEDFFHVFLGLWRVPDIVGINDHGRALRAGVEASGFVDAHLTFEAIVVNALFQVVQKVRRSAGGTASTRVVFFALVVANENMFLKAAHENLIAKGCG